MACAYQPPTKKKRAGPVDVVAMPEQELIDLPPDAGVPDAAPMQNVVEWNASEQSAVEAPEPPRDEESSYCIQSTSPPMESYCWKGLSRCEELRPKIGEFTFTQCEKVQRVACVRYWRKLEEEWSMICVRTYSECEESRAMLLKRKADFSKVQKCAAVE